MQGSNHQDSSQAARPCLLYCLRRTETPQKHKCDCYSSPVYYEFTPVGAGSFKLTATAIKLFTISCHLTFWHIKSWCSLVSSFETLFRRDNSPPQPGWEVGQSFAVPRQDFVLSSFPQQPLSTKCRQCLQIL